MKLARNVVWVLLGVSTLFFTAAQSSNAQLQPVGAPVRVVQGSATICIDGIWQPLKENTTVTAGAVIKTSASTALDLFLPYSRTVLRLMPDSVLQFDRLDEMPAADEGFVTMTRLNLQSGTLIGSQHKLASPSEFEIRLPNAVARIVGTEYVLRADGAVACLKGNVSVSYNSQSKAPSAVSVSAGFLSNPATGKAGALNTAYLQNIASDMQAVRNNAQVCDSGHPNPASNHCDDDHVSPTKDHDHDHDGDHDGNGHGGDHDHDHDHDNDHGGKGHK